MRGYVLDFEMVAILVPETVPFLLALVTRLNGTVAWRSIYACGDLTVNNYESFGFRARR